jgi:hypothetical protein
MRLPHWPVSRLLDLARGAITSYALASAPTVPITSAQAGSSVILYGRGFGFGAGTVTIAGVAATVTAWATGQVTVTLGTYGAYPAAGVVLLRTAQGEPILGSFTVTQPAFLLDTFTDGTGVLLTAHTGEVGASWTLSPVGISSPVITNNRARGQAARGHSYASGLPPDASYAVSGTLRCITNPGGGAHTGVMGRIKTLDGSGYSWGYESANSRYELLRWDGGGPVTLAFGGAEVLAAGNERLLKLTVSGNTITGYVDGVQAATATDATYPTAGRAGLLFTGPNNTAVAGFHLADILGQDI